MSVLTILGNVSYLSIASNVVKVSEIEFMPVPQNYTSDVSEVAPALCLRRLC